MEKMVTTRCDVAVIGAGPYGLAATAHLRSAGVETRVFGQEMSFWKQMPAGMFLRSSWQASFISDPAQAFTLDKYQQANGLQLTRPLPLADFIRYGQWFQHQVAPDLDRRCVGRVEPASGGFRLILEDGEAVCASRVVVATGISMFAWRPPQFDHLPRRLSSHSADHRDLGRFAGRRVVVVGGGQSALESAALLNEAGAEVEIVIRAPIVHWLGTGAQVSSLPGPARRLVRKLLYPPTDVGPLGLNWIVALPDLFRRFPRGLQHRIADRSIRPAGALWLKDRLQDVQITTGHAITSAAPCQEGLHLHLDDGTERSVDYLLLATGYRVDVSRYGFLAPKLLRAVRRIDGYPRLVSGFRSSVPGLYFIGAPAAETFGPVMRFVAGTTYTTRALTRHIVR